MVTFFIDIDDTIGDATPRMLEAGSEPPREPFSEYDAWLNRLMREDKMIDDPVVPGMVAFVKALARSNQKNEIFDVVYLTARSIKHRDVTKRWLQKHSFPNLRLIMRPDGDLSTNHDLKERIIQDFWGDKVVIDDDPSGKLAEVCLKNGWTFLKANPLKVQQLSTCHADEKMIASSSSKG